MKTVLVPEIAVFSVIALLFRNFDNFGPNCKIFATLVLFKFKKHFKPLKRTWITYGPLFYRKSQFWPSKTEKFA